MALFFALQIFLLLYVWWILFTSSYWEKHFWGPIILFLAPFLFGLGNITFLTYFFSVETLRAYRQLLYLYSTINSLLLIPQWYKLMWLFLTHLPSQRLNDTQKLLATVLLSIIMIIAIVFFFTLYYLWIDSLSGYTQGLRSAMLNYQPILLDFSSSFYFSFVVYFSLGFGDLVPYGTWFHFLVFLECLISLLNTGIIIIYAYNFLFSQNDSS